MDDNNELAMAVREMRETFGQAIQSRFMRKLSLVATGRLIYSRAMSMISPLQAVMLAVVEDRMRLMNIS